MAQHEQGDESRSRIFNPNEHVIQLKSKNGSADYLPVQFRLVWFRTECPHGTIDTEELEVDHDRDFECEGYAWNEQTRRSEKVVKKAKGYARYRAVVTDGQGGRATGTKSERAVDFPDYVEKAETGAIGRALAALGYGTQFAPELNEEHRIVDAPVERSSSSDGRKPSAAVRPATSENGSTESAEGAPATGQQLASIQKLRQHLGKPELEQPGELSYQEAKEMLSQLSAEYRQSRKSS